MKCIMEKSYHLMAGILGREREEGRGWVPVSPLKASLPVGPSFSSFYYLLIVPSW
jgi:hypothetical protein